MQIFIIIFYVNLILWLIPPFRQYKTKYFLFFLALALSDPFMYLIYVTVHLPAPNIYVFNVFIVILTLLEKPTLKKYKVIFASLALIALYLSFQKSYPVHLPLIAFNLSIALLLVLKRFLIELREEQGINIFSVVIVFYFVLMLQKILFRLAYIETGHLYLHLSNIFQLSMCVYFIRYNTHTSKRLAFIKKEPA